MTDVGRDKALREITPDYLRRALPEIIDWLEVETVVFKTERKHGNADFCDRVVKLFKAFLSTPPSPEPGWVMVPREFIEAVKAHLDDVRYVTCLEAKHGGFMAGSGNRLRDAYDAAMLSAAPVLTAPEGERDRVIEDMTLFEYQWRSVARCAENYHIMPALKAFGEEGWEVFQVEPTINKEDEDIYGVWMRRALKAKPTGEEGEK